jgi:uncharacterized protein (TIGR02246 family)
MEAFAMTFDHPEQQAVWNTVRALNDAWTKGNPDELVNYFHQDMVAITATDQNRRVGRDACLAGWKDFAHAATIHHWKEIDPLVQLYGDSAVVTYDFDIAFDMGGNALALKGRDMFVLVKENGRWVAVADHFSPAPMQS